MAGGPFGSLAALYRDAFAGLPRLTWLLCTAAFLNRCGSMVVPFLNLYSEQEFGFDPEQAGVLLSTYGAGAFVGSWLGGWLTDRFGPIRAQVWTLGSSGLWMLAMIAVRDPAALFVSVFVLGVLNDAFRPGSITAVAFSAPPAQQRKALALNRLALNLGWSFGPAIGGLLTAIDFRWMFVADGATCLIAAAFLAARFWSWRPDVPPRARLGWSLPFRDRHFLWLMTANLVVLLGFMQYFTTGSRVFKDDGYSKRQIGMFLAVNPIMITLFEMTTVHLLRRHRALPIVAAGSAVIGLGYLCMFLPWGAGAVVVAMVAVAIGELLQMPLLGAHVNDHAPAYARGAYNGAYGMTFCLALLLAPVLGGWLYAQHGAAALWWSCAGLGVVGAALFATAPKAPSPPGA
jgi:predicted MFS family arabinose efflux permease